MALHTILFLSLLFSMMPLFRAECQDDGITLSFSEATYEVEESAGSVKPVLVLSDPIDCCSTVSVWVDIKEISTDGANDFEAPSPMQVLIPGGETSAMFDVRIIGDVMLESSEKLRVSIDPLSLPFGVVLGNTPTAEVVIMDDDEAIVSFETRQYEFEEGDGSVEVTISLSQLVPFNTSLELQTIDDTTTSRCDYEPEPYNVPIPTGVTTFTYNFSILDDDVYEIDEEFTLAIHSSEHSRHIIIDQGMDTVRITIKDDEEPIYVSFDEPIFIVNERDGVVSPVITLSKPTPCCLNLYVEVEDITANRGDDYGDTDTVRYLVTFPAGTNCSSFDIPIINDTLSEGDESFSVTILEMSLPFGTMLGNSTTTEVVIVDNDMNLNFSNGTYSVFEDEGSLCIYLILDKPSLIDTTVEVNEFNVSTNRGEDYESGPYFVDITKGDTTAEICIGITDDNKLEMDDPETFILRINTITLHPEIIPVFPDSAIVDLHDDEYTFNFDQPIYVVQENDSNVTVTLEFSIDLRNDTIVQFRYTNLSAIGNDTIHSGSETVDYNTAYAWPYYAIVPKGSRTFKFDITTLIIDDEELEDNELFRIYVDEPMRADDVLPVQADIIIMNDDDFVIGFDFQSYSIGKNDPETPIIKFHKFPGIYNLSMFFPVEVIIQQVNGTAVGGYIESDDVDFVIQDYSYTFNYTNQTYPVILRPIDDNIVEPDEYFTLVFTLVGKRDHFVIDNQEVNVTIENDDVCTVRINEQSGRDTLYFSKQLATNITVVITYEDGTGNVTVTEEFTAEETKTKNNFVLPNKIINITVRVPKEFRRSSRDNVVAEDKRITIDPPYDQV